MHNQLPKTKEPINLTATKGKDSEKWKDCALLMNLEDIIGRCYVRQIKILSYRIMSNVLVDASFNRTDNTMQTQLMVVLIKAQIIMQL